jgi:hypothetical protein
MLLNTVVVVVVFVVAVAIIVLKPFQLLLFTLYHTQILSKAVTTYRIIFIIHIGILKEISGI